MEHASADSCWSIIHGVVYDLTPFLKSHPGGSAILLKYAGKDATKPFDASGHPLDIASKLGLDYLVLGRLAESSESTAQESAAPAPAPAVPKEGLPPLDSVVNIFDLESLAKTALPGEAWDYYSSGADDEVTLRENHLAFHRIYFRPRVLVDVSSIDLATTLLGCSSSLPVYITATALGRLAHPDGETALVRAAHAQGIVYMLPTLASCTLEEMLRAKQPDQPLFYQLYVNSDRAVTARLVQQAERGGCRALFLTVDAPQLGRREKDLRRKFTLAGTAVQKPDDRKGQVDRSQGISRAISQFIDPSLNWNDIAWLRSITRMPIVLKGVQRGEDAVRAARIGLAGVVCSNHGGRQLDFARSGIEVLPEVMAALRAEGLEQRVQVFVDGGVRRATDVLKALALGARAVGIGRPALWGLSTYGQAGVEKVLSILRDEMVVGMRLLGCARIDDITPDLVAAPSLTLHAGPVAEDVLSARTYVPLGVASKL